MRYTVFLLCSGLFLLSCQNADTGAKPRLTNDRLYFDYQVSAAEDRDEATVRIQYRWDNEEGAPVLLESPATVLFDGKPPAIYHPRRNGVYYEVSKPVTEIIGKHRIYFRDAIRQVRNVDFYFMPFSLAEELPEKMSKKPFTIRLKDLPLTPVRVRLVMTDTSLYSDGVNEELLVRNGELAIDSAMLNSIEPGPVTVEIYHDEKIPISHSSKAGGRLVLTYSIKRQIEFVR